MSSSELREAADDVERFLAGEPTNFDLTETAGRLVDAARTIALPILEADPELVDTLDLLFQNWRLELNGLHRQQLARDVLAAISTPTPGEES